jgi:tubulin monoglycylase TTLL3/8
VVRALRRVNATPDCQAALNEAPAANVWIAKPSGKSRGRGIVCEKRLSRVLWRQGGEGGGSTLGKSAAGGGYIVQKYIERPLLVHDRKFDIRQWVLVTSWAPLEVWMYARCYARFCAWPFALGDVGNRFAHLSNNSVQKHSAAFAASGIEGNMWTGEALAAWVQARAGEGRWDGADFSPLPRGGRGAGFVWGRQGRGVEGGGPGEEEPEEPPPRAISACANVWEEVVLPQVRAMVVAALMAAQDGMAGNPGCESCWEQFGFDVMLDAGLRAWLIEVNSTPDMWYTTTVTEELVKEASEGMAALLCEGGFGCAPRGGGGGAKCRAAAPPIGTALGGWQLIYAAPSASAVPIPAFRSAPAAGLAVVGAALSQAELAAMAGRGGGGGAQQQQQQQQQRQQSGAGKRAGSVPRAAGAAAPTPRAPSAQQPPVPAPAPAPALPRLHTSAAAAAARHGSGGIVGARARPPLQPTAPLPLKEAKVDFAPPALPPRASSTGRAAPRKAP